MKITRLQAALQAAGLDARRITLVFNGKEIAAICVNHEYNGYYPTRDALQASVAAGRLAYKYGYYHEQRGYYTATYIYDKKCVEG